MANPLKRTFSSSQVSDWFPSSRAVAIPSRQQTIDVEYLVIAGGGGGSSGTAAGGGAGGYRSSVEGEQSGATSSAEQVFQAIAGLTYGVSVGAGGSASTGLGTKGSNSVFGSINSEGGGYGGRSGGVTNGGNGGSGGGGMNYSGQTALPGAGTANQGFNGGTANTNSGGGGGGAGAIGGATNGGAGLYSSITGVSIIRAGGGGGSQTGIGGAGGGGNGTGGSIAGSGSVNTGSGGGGSWTYGTTSGSGGSGIVILRSKKPAASTVGSPTYTTFGDYHVYTFTASGSITY